MKCRGPCDAGGAALVVSLVLMLALTVLGVSAMNMSMLELAMATGMESQQGAFEAAETGIEIALAQPAFATVAPAHVPAMPVGEGPFETQTSTVCVTTTAVPDVGFSIGAGSGAIQAFHFEVVSVGTGPRGAVSTHRSRGFGRLLRGQPPNAVRGGRFARATPWRG